MLISSVFKSFASLHEVNFPFSCDRNPFFSRLARPLPHQRTLFNWGDANSQLAKEGWSFEECDAAKEGGSFEECDAAKPRKNVMQLTQVLNAQKRVHNKRESVLQLNC